MQPGDIVQVTINDITSSGWGVGRTAENAVVFVPGTIPGETVMVKITKSRKSYFRGVIARISDKSPGRIEPQCEHAAKCPGCSLQHMSYETQCEAKRARIGRILTRAIGREISPRLIPSPQPFGYRTHLAIGCERRGNEVVMGFTDPETREIVDIPSCMLIPEWADREYARLRESLRRSADRLPPNFRMRLFVDHINKEVCVVAPRGPKREHRRVPEGFDTSLEGFPSPKTIERTILGVTLRLHPASFVQANQFMAEALYSEALKVVQPKKSDTLCELYAGSGFFTLALAPKVSRVVAVEADKRAAENLAKSAEDLLKNAKRSKKPEVEIQIAQGRAEDLAKEIMDEFKPTLVISNPPRSGMHPDVTKALAESETVRRTVMISCDPATCARDVKVLMAGGFVPEDPVLLDCYPQTPHVEIVMALSR